MSVMQVVGAGVGVGVVGWVGGHDNLDSLNN